MGSAEAQQIQEALMNHPCNHYSCCENYHGECYGEGCRLNPMPEPSEPDTEDGDDDSNN